MMPVRTPDTIAFEAAAALDAYEARMARMARGVATPADLALAAGDLHRLCARCMHLPRVSASCIGLLLSHYRLLASLAGADDACLAPSLRRAHQACIERLRQECREFFLAPHLH
ncbi:hypothetical protein H8N03_21025 [Ramlibacter sp. USB13]|uniref:Uncharacterized protein n=1 Tax=Ramlibacter cellulosilyticus TaxID=2764187 RepID=A0A923MVJ7_9BURK|nr:hypothetical protein [Ramlibacter cellulosilyticus]MBC5785444.1 hypothetical protein [Ramlibacter cellulosilyticus]